MKMVPLISSGLKGPLGVLHLPRLWQKVLLGAQGILADGYPDCGKGFDQLVLDSLKINREVALEYLRNELPSYPEFEQWILKQRGGKIPQDEIDALNSAIINYQHGDSLRKEILGAAGVTDTGSIKDAINLNNIDDWTAFHAQLKNQKLVAV